MQDSNPERSPQLDDAHCERWAREHGLAAHREARELECVGEDSIGRPLRMTPRCAERWHPLQAAASEDGIEMLLISAFRSVEHQRGIFLRKLARGESLRDILCVNAAPGYSEHHSGRALDLGTPGCEDLSLAFEATAAFSWLCENAARFDFELSYPRDNPFGIAYEPWHWALREDASVRRRTA
jgi:D-alanyl-D-alanine carboxypeptidase